MNLHHESVCLVESVYNNLQLFSVVLGAQLEQLHSKNVQGGSIDSLFTSTVT